ncbi:MAG: hypothetical protein MUP41_20155 [Desulfobacterales bacterium]|nr:hypothetical protein [Desulfobacterales bacterium]
MMAYEFYWRDEVKGYELLGVLPERRKDPARITEKSVLGWVNKVFGNEFSAKDIYFIQATINENTGMIFRPSPTSFENIPELLGEIQMESNGIDELVERTSQGLQVDHVKCMSCGRKKSEYEMQKVLYKKYKGICKMCFKSEIER